MSEEEPKGVLRAMGEIELPDGQFVESTLFIASYIDAEGHHKFGWRQQGESNVATMVGLMEMIKLSMLVETMT